VLRSIYENLIADSFDIQVLAMGFFGSVYGSVSAGLGRPMTELNLHSEVIESLNRYSLASNLLWVISLCVSKVAIMAMLLRTTQTVSDRRAQYGVGGLVAVQCIVSIILLTADCSLSREFAWSMNSASSECPKSETRWQVITALDVVTEISLLVLPVELVWNLQMSVRNKLIVISAFWLRIPYISISSISSDMSLLCHRTIVFSALRQNQTHNLTTTSDISLTASIVVVWQAVELSYSLAAATIAALKRFTESLNTGFGHGELMRVHGSSNYKLSDRSGIHRNTKTSHADSARSKEPSVNVDTVSSRFSHTDSGLETQPTHIKLRPGRLQNTAVISSPPKDSMTDTRSMGHRGSEDNIIRQERRYSVHYEESSVGRA
jgi:hypothetical protein